MSAYLLLLSTDHCALCEDAMSMLMSMPELAGMELRVVDVATDNELLDRFGERLPVLQFWISNRNELELDWPFTSDQLGREIRRLVPQAC